MPKKPSRLFGPAMLVTAAFIGPGTVLTASRAGAQYGFSLLWAVAFSTLTAIILQEMAGRLGIVTGGGLAQSIRRSLSNPVARWAILGLVLAAILIGNAAFQTGNLLGAASGIESLSDSSLSDSSLSDSSLSDSSSTASRNPSGQVQSAAARSDMIQSTTTGLPPNSTSGVFSFYPGLVGWVLINAVVAWALIMTGHFDWIRRILTWLVGVMSVTFFASTLIGMPSLAQLLAGLIPTIPEGSGWLVVGLIGTTVVPYNLFLHASATSQRWPADSVSKTADKQKAVKESSRDTWISVGLGGLITAAILITAATAFHVEPAAEPSAATAQTSSDASFTKVSDIARQLEPALGSWARILFGLGLFAAGFSSTITAPIAAAYTVAGAMGWPDKLSDWRLKMVASFVLLCGVVFSVAFGSSPQQAILMAQSLNGLLLPILAILLVVMMNRVQTMFHFRNHGLQNSLAIAAIIMVTAFAVRQLIDAYAKWNS